MLNLLVSLRCSGLAQLCTPAQHSVMIIYHRQRQNASLPDIYRPSHDARCLATASPWLPLVRLSSNRYVLIGGSQGMHLNPPRRCSRCVLNGTTNFVLLFFFLAAVVTEYECFSFGQRRLPVVTNVAGGWGQAIRNWQSEKTNHDLTPTSLASYHNYGRGSCPYPHSSQPILMHSMLPGLKLTWAW